MDITGWIATHCERTYRMGNWAGKGVLPAIEGVTTEQASWRPNAEQHTIAELVLHMAYWKDAATARLSGLPWKYDEMMDWRPVPATVQDWEEAKAELQRAHDRLIAALRSLTVQRLAEPVGKAWWLESGRADVIDYAIGVTHHDMYHAAQIFVLRRFFKHR